MPQTEVYFYQDERGRVPVVEWLTELRQSDRRAYAKCVARIRRLAAAGHELRRPEADFLRDGVYELRARQGHVNYRILYFFHVFLSWPKRCHPGVRSHQRGRNPRGGHRPSSQAKSNLRASPRAAYV